MLRSQLADLWKSRVQHLRQYYCFHGHKPKQRSSPAISRHVWFIPLILTLWWLLIAVMFSYALKMERLLSTGEVLRYMLFLNYLLTILWWKLAVIESEGTTKTRFRNGPHCSCFMCTNHRNGCIITNGNVSTVILPLRDNWKCYRRRRVLHTVHYSDHQVVTSLLLILAGDVETNPGPDWFWCLPILIIICAFSYVQKVAVAMETQTQTSPPSTPEVVSLPVQEGVQKVTAVETSPPSTPEVVSLSVLEGSHTESSTYKEGIPLLHDAHQAGLQLDGFCTESSAYKEGMPLLHVCDDAHQTGPQQHGSHNEKDHQTGPEQIPVTVDFKTLLNELSEVQSKWYEIGIQLGIKTDNLDVFKEDHYGRTARCFIETLNYWTGDNTDVPVSWESIINVLNDPIVNKPAIANRLQRKYCVETPKKAEPPPSNQSNSLPSNSTGATRLCNKESSQSLGNDSKSAVVHYKYPDVWPPSWDDHHFQTFLAMLRKETKKMQSDFSSLFGSFKNSFLNTCTDNDFDDLDLLSAPLNLDKTRLEGIRERRDTKSLLMQIYYHQSFMNFEFFVKKVIEKFGSDIDKQNAKNYIESFEKYARCRIYEPIQNLLPDIPNYCTAVFIIDTPEAQLGHEVREPYDFISFLCELLGMEPYTTFIYKVVIGSLVIYLQIPCTELLSLQTIPLFPNKIKSLRDRSVKLYKFGKREVLLKHWKVLTDITLRPADILSKESSPNRKKIRMISAQYQGKECIALLYPNDFESTIDSRYVEYLEILNHDHKEVPSIIGLYYPAAEEGMMKYPVVIIEKLKSFREIAISNSYYAESEVNQLSLLSSVASCMSRFERLNQNIKVTLETIFIQQNGTELETKFIPVYDGDSLSEELPNPPRIPYSDLLWMKDVITIFSNDNAPHAEFLSNHLLKNSFEQRWLSKKSHLRPATYSALASELQDFLELEKTWLGLATISGTDTVKNGSEIHFVLIGFTGAGKTSLRKHLKDEPIDDDESPTIVMESEFLYRELMAAVDGSSAFKPLLHVQSEDKVFLTMWDTGGQPIFQDLLPCFARFNCMYGIVFRLSDLENLDQKPEIRPMKSFLPQAVSPFTHKDIIYRDLSFVQAFSCSMEVESLPLPIRPHRQAPSVAAVIVGTHKDKAPESTKSLETDLNNNISRFAEKFRNTLSICSVPDKNDFYIHEVDNTKSGQNFSIGDPGIESLRNSITFRAKKSSIEIPCSWQTFKVALQRMCYTNYVNIGIIPLADAISIGREKCNVEDPKAALMYFHELGVFMWYHLSEKRTMRNFVVIDPKALLQVLATLFCYDPKTLKEEWKILAKRGIMPMNFYRHLLSKKPSEVDDHWFMEFLEEHHLSFQISFLQQEICYFIPSILPTTEKYEDNLKLFNGKTPLYIVPESGYIATGMFTRLLTVLAGVTYSHTKWKIPPVSSQCIQVCRNQFEFMINEDSIHLILSEFSQYIRIDCVSNEDASTDIYAYITSTLIVHLQRIVPRWLEKQEFELTLSCSNSSCPPSSEPHFYSMKSFVSDSKTVKCSNGESSQLKESELLWFRNENINITSNDNDKEAAALFNEALNQGSLNISVTSVLFLGISSSDVTSAKHIALQECVPTTLQTTSSVEHEIYFRAADSDNELFQKMEMKHYNEIVAFTMSRDKETEMEPECPKEQKSEVHVVEASSRSPVHPYSVTPLEPSHPESPSEPSHPESNVSPLYHPIEGRKSEAEAPKSTQDVDQVFGSVSVEDTIKFISQYKDKGKMELLHIIDCGSNFFKLNGILNLFIRHVTLYALVMDSSKELSPDEPEALLLAETPTSKLVIIETYKEGTEHKTYHLNCKTPGNSDSIDSSITKHAISGADSKIFPFTWYIFNFKLKESINSFHPSIRILSVSKHCMKIGKELNMDRPIVEAALVHLTEHNMILYFKDILSDVVFSEIAIFSDILSSLYDKISSNRKASGQKLSIFDKADLRKIVEPYTDGLGYVSENDFVILFEKLLIIFQFDSSTKYIMPCLLQSLEETERQQVCSNSIDPDLVPLVIKCPSSGNELVPMLISCLLNQSWIIPKDQSGNPVCLNKNCIKFRAEKLHSVITVTFKAVYIEVYVKSEDKIRLSNYYHQVALIMLQSLEKIKVIKGGLKSWKFSISFYCDCGRNGEHVCEYRYGSRCMVCEKDEKFAPSYDHMKWLGGEKTQEPLTITNAANELLDFSDKWIMVASLLCLPDSVRNYIGVSRNKDNKGALKKTVEWWFMNNPNPEWDEIQRIKVYIESLMNKEFQEKFEKACRDGNLDAAKGMLQLELMSSPEILRCGLFMAAEHGHQNIMDLITEFEANIIDAQDLETGSTALIVASKAGQYDTIQQLLDLGGNPDIQDRSGWCPLLIAVNDNALHVIDLILRSGRANININNNDGKTALILAVENQNIRIIKALLGEKASVEALQPWEPANIEAQDKRGRTALHAAVESENMEIVKYLINASPASRDITDIKGIRPVDIAREKQQMDMVELLGSDDESVEDEDESLDRETDQGKQMKISWYKKIPLADEAKLMRAAKAGKRDKVEKLLKKKAHPNTVEFDSLQWTPLMWASHRGHHETVEVLLQYGADPNKDASNGFTALMLASRRGNYEVVRVLLDPKHHIKTEVDRKNKTRGWSALMWASQSKGSKKFTSPEAEANRRKVAELLLNAGADVNIKAKNGWTPLMQASQDGHTELVKMFSEVKSIDIDHESESSWTALTTACRKERTAIIQVLVAAGANVNKRKRGGLTAAHIASYKGLERKAIEALVKKTRPEPTDVNAQDEWGMTPLMLAVMQRHTEMMRYLIEEAYANVNIVAEKYCKWTAIFFAVQNKDQDTIKMLIERGATLSIKDECNHDILGYSKGLVFSKRIYKYLSTKVHYTAEEETLRSHEIRAKSPTLKDRAFYASRGALWRSTQLIHFYNSF